MGKVGVVLLLGLIFMMPAQVSAEVTFGSNVQVDDGLLNVQQDSPAIATDAQGNIYVVWVDWRNGNRDIYFAKSTDSGATFGADVRIDDTGLADILQDDPAIAVDADGNIYVVWFDRRNGSMDIYFAKSTDGGASFGPNVRVDDGVGGTQFTPDIAVDQDGNIYVVWHDNRRGIWNIFFAKSTDGGTTFSPNIRVDEVPNYNSFPSIAVDTNGNIYVAWHNYRSNDHDIYFAKSTDGGTSFGPSVRVDDTGPASSSYQENPSIGVDPDGNIYIVWQDTRNGYYDIYFAKSTDGGATFGPNVRVDDTGPVSSYQGDPSIAVDPNGNIYVAWTDERNGNKDIYFAQSTDGGATFGPNVRVDDTGSLNASQSYPSIAVDQNENIYVTWQDRRYGNTDIYFARSVYQLNMTEMNWYENIAPYYSTGAATAQMILNYIREGAGEPLLTQDEIYQYAKDPQPYGPELNADEVDKALGHFDPYDYLVSNSYDIYDDLPGGNPYQGYNFLVDTHDPQTNPQALNEYIRNIAHWMAYLVPQEYGLPPGDLVARPNTPAALPIFGSYDNWVTVKGCVTSAHPAPDPNDPWYTPDFTVYGFWIKDPQITGIGQDTYKTAAECALTYFQPLVTTDPYDGLFLQVAEPPLELSTAQVKLAPAKPDFANLQFIGLEVASPQEQMPAPLKHSWRDLVAPYLLTDKKAVAAFEETTMRAPILVQRPDREDTDYLLLPFDKQVKGKGALTSAVIILDAQQGYFKEATWTKTPERFLKVNREDALKLIREYLLKHTSKQPNSRSYTKLIPYLEEAEAELIWQPNSYSASPYAPYWQVEINGHIWYVTQEGEVIPELGLEVILNEIEGNSLLMDKLLSQ